MEKGIGRRVEDYCLAPLPDASDHLNKYDRVNLDSNYPPCRRGPYRNSRGQISVQIKRRGSRRYGATQIKPRLRRRETEHRQRENSLEPHTSRPQTKQTVKT